jgi:hypothetical protein
VAVIKEVPVATPVTRPVGSIVAAAGVAEFQVTAAVRSAVVALAYVPVAVICRVEVVVNSVGSNGVTAIETSGAGATVTVVLPEMSPNVAETTEPPFAVTPVTRPPVLTVTFACIVEPQITDAVRSAVVASA